MVVSPQRTTTARQRFRTPPWHETHPNKLQLEQRLDPDHLARTLDQAVARLDLAPLQAAYHGTGSLAHPPERLLRAGLYEIRRGHLSPAAWHRDARECEPVRWLLRGAVVARSCWYTFRDRLGPLLPALHQQVLAQALAEGLTPATRAAGDGTLVAANASRHKLLHQEGLQRRATQLAAALADDRPPSVSPAAPAAATPAPAAVTPTPPAPAQAWDGTPALPASAPAAAGDPPAPAAPPPAPPTRPAWLATSTAGRLQQQERLQQAQARLDELQGQNQRKWPSKRKATAAIVVSPSDPEAVVGRDKEKVYRPLYNVQFFDDLDSPFILAYDVFAQQNDTGVLGRMLAQVRQQLGHGLEVVLVDGAYAGGADLAAAAQAGVTVYAPVPGDGVAQPKQIPKREFGWQAAEQTYVCPQGHRLLLEESWREKRVDGDLRVWRYRCPPGHCLGCPLQARCTKTPAKGRAVTRQEHEELVEALRARMATAEAKALYRLRNQNVELVNADVKQHRKLRRFSGRGLTRARNEVGLVVLVHNLLTLVKEGQKPKAKEGPAVATNAEPNST